MKSLKRLARIWVGINLWKAKGVETMKQKVKIKFMRSMYYDNSYFVQFDEFVLTLGDAIDLVNNEIAVIVYIYNL